MQYLINVPIDLGDTVLDDQSGSDGVVIERLDEEYVRVRWGGRDGPTTHHQGGLVRTVAAARRWH